MVRVRSIFLGFLLTFCLLAVATAQNFTDPATEQKITDLIQQMTVEEKAGQLNQLDTRKPETPGMIREGKIGSLFNVLGAQNVNELQHIAVEHSRLKIPVLFGYDVIHGYRTTFPIPLAEAGSFDPALIEQAERVAAKEASASGVKWVFAPMVDIARDPRWGRIVEGAGEDPYLGSVIAAARVRGFQGENFADPQNVIACVKHFAAYGAVEGGRDYNTVDISEQTLREVYLPPFQAALKAGVGTFMSAFMDLDGVPGAANHHTLTEILRNEWGFQGFVVSDYSAVDEIPTHGIATGQSDAVREAITAGVDMDMADGAYGKDIPALVQSDKLPMSVLDEAVRRVLRIKFKAGLFDHPYTDPAREATDIYTPENIQIARKMADESIVLLKNSEQTLPLSTNLKTVAVIGPLAYDKADQLGPWAAQGRAVDAITPFEAIKARLPNATVLYSAGVELKPFPGSPDAAHPQSVGVGPAPPSATGVAGGNRVSGPVSIEDAVATAQKSDAVVMVLGELAWMSGEASSRATLTLPGEQEKLLEAVVATGKPVVLVLESGHPQDIRWANDHVPAIVQAWFLGVQSGNAISDILFGDVNPSAKLPISWPRSVGQIPVYYDHKNTGRPSSPDRWHTGYLDESKEPLFPFGFGLSYTTFQYGNLQVQTPTISSTGTLRVQAEVQNTGNRAGTEVVEFYVHDRIAPTSRPVRELKGFSRVTLAPGERKTVEFNVSANDLGSYNPEMKWIVPPGTYDVWVGPSSTDGIHGTFEVAEN